MPTIKEVLEKKTYKDDLDTIHERVYYTLTDVKGGEVTRTAALLSLTIERLYDKGIIDEQDIDEMLLEIAG